jgi:uncharacterized protein (TIGR03546 family)
MNKKLSTWQKFYNSVEGKNSSRQLAAGVVFGMLIGLMPKDSLLVVISAIILILSPANLLSAAISALAFSFLGSIPSLNSAMHVLGTGVLGQDFIQETFRIWWSLPLVAWTRINNSIAVGSIVLWAALLIPVYLMAWCLFDRVGDRIYQSVKESRVFCWVIGAKKAKLNEG